MNFEQINQLIEALPTLIMYLVPGYLILWINAFVLSIKLENDRYVLLKSVVLSYVILTLGNYILSFKGLSIFGSNLLKIVTLGVAITVGYSLSKFILSECFCRILKFLGINKSFFGNFWNDIVDLENGLWVIAYIPTDQVIYKGQLRKFEEKNNSESSFLVLSNYTTLTYSSEVLADYQEQNEKRVIINTKDISRLELYYSPKSRKIS